MKQKQNFFHLFGLPQDYKLNIAELESRYKKLQKEFHPDRFVTGTLEEKRLSLEKSGMVNEGFKILKTPITRAAHILYCMGISYDENAAVSPDFLQKQMEIYEKLAKLREAKDLTGMEKLKAALTSEFAKLENDFVSAIDEKKDEILLEHFYRMQFLDKIRREVINHGSFENQ